MILDRLHAAARSDLAAWRAPEAAQEELRRLYLDHLDRHPDAMSRTCGAGHLTASAAIVDPGGTSAVLTLHRKIGKWLQTGGHCEEGDASLGAAALREAAEESGLSGLRLLPGPVRLDRHRVGCGGGTWHLDVQYAAVAAQREAPLSIDAGESSDLGWFAVGDIPEPTDDACRTLVRAAAEAARARPEPGFAPS
ncbi:NUDIX domain-containing protein [Streptomonospora wellingtoniae]|uniref:NUDIX domain-containing protein n=1 Tax=Streptomonospora wellingtoniae TaxID=3075544 RepID=A0ABU2KQG6_9ACTN|nr:NUDIX domain-containing protein [Streptomonospora sp. DSM 45055]MDT0301515.1 NUDIX domain-containing protein [Streptomonospora sp. DSM 45055]